MCKPGNQGPFGRCARFRSRFADGVCVGIGSIGMRLTLEDVEHVAALARLGLSPEEKERMRDQLSSILESIEALQELDTSAIPPTAQTIHISNVMRDDVVRPSLTQAQVLQNAPRHTEGFFEVHTPLGGADEDAG